jgi:hypothetical protein
MGTIGLIQGADFGARPATPNRGDTFGRQGHAQAYQNEVCFFARESLLGSKPYTEKSRALYVLRITGRSGSVSLWRELTFEPW